jgi:hypothetical protein
MAQSYLEGVLLSFTWKEYSLVLCGGMQYGSVKPGRRMAQFTWKENGSVLPGMIMNQF